MSYRLLMAADLQGYSSRSGAVQRTLQAGLREVLTAAAVRADLHPESWPRQGSGDGEFVVLPYHVPAETLVDRFVRELNAELRQHNRTASDEARLRVRVAIHHGPAKEAENGYGGAGPVVVTRLCNGTPLRAALGAAGADLGLIVSEVVFRGTIEAQETSLEPEDLRRVRLPELERDQDAWIWIPGFAGLPALVFDDGVPATRDRTPAAAESATGSATEQPPAPPQAPPAETAGRSAFTGASINNPGGTIIGGDHYDLGGRR